MTEEITREQLELFDPAERDRVLSAGWKELHVEYCETYAGRYRITTTTQHPPCGHAALRQMKRLSSPA